MDGGSARREGGGGARSEAVSNLPPASEARALHALVFFLLEPERSLHRRVRHIDSGELRRELWHHVLSSESPTRLELRGVYELGGDHLERRRDQRQDLVAVVRGREDALHVSAGALALRLDAGSVLNIGVRKRGQQLGLTAPYEARVWRVVLEVLIRLLVHGLDVKYVPVGAVR